MAGVGSGEALGRKIRGREKHEINLRGETREKDPGSDTREETSLLESR